MQLQRKVVELAKKFEINCEGSLNILTKFVEHYHNYEGSMDYRDYSLRLMKEAHQMGDPGLIDAIEELKGV